MRDDTRVGFVGLGRMGYPMATRLTDGPLTVFDTDIAAAGGLIERGATMASSVTHLAELADLILVRVPGEEQVRSVVADILPSRVRVRRSSSTPPSDPRRRSHWPARRPPPECTSSTPR